MPGLPLAPAGRLSTGMAVIGGTSNHRARAGPGELLQCPPIMMAGPWAMVATSSVGAAVSGGRSRRRRPTTCSGCLCMALPLVLLWEKTAASFLGTASLGLPRVRPLVRISTKSSSDRLRTVGLLAVAARSFDLPERVGVPQARPLHHICTACPVQRPVFAWRWARAGGSSVGTAQVGPRSLPPHHSS